MIQFIKNQIKDILIKRLLKEDQDRRAHLPKEFNGLTPELWDCSINDAGHLCVQDRDLTEIAAEFGSPLYVVDKQRLVKNYQKFVGAFRDLYPKVELGTSYKTNPLPGVLQALHEAGTYAEVISHFELWLALRLGLPGERILFNGPGKGVEGMKLAVQKDVQVINVDSLYEVEVIAEEARRLGKIQPVGVRVVTSVGWSSQFGLSIAEGRAMEAYEAIAQQDSLKAMGMHMHLGTGIKNIPTYVQAVREMLDFAVVLREKLDIEIDAFDFGGGFGVPTVRTHEEWDGRLIALGFSARDAIPDDCPHPADYAKPLVDLFRQYYPEQGEQQPEMVFEPGRAITSSAQILLIGNMTRKPGVKGMTNLIMDGGKNITMPLGWEAHQIFPVNRMTETPSVQTNVFGPLCHPGDVITKNKLLPPMEPGELLAIMDAGAYFLPNQMNFSNPRPGAVLLDDGEATMIRAPEQFDNIVELDQLPDINDTALS